MNTEVIDQNRIVHRAIIVQDIQEAVSYTDEDAPLLTEDEILDISSQLDDAIQETILAFISERSR